MENPRPCKYTEFLTLRNVENQLLATLEEHFGEIPEGSMKLLIRLQKTKNNAIMKVITKITDNKAHHFKKMTLSSPVVGGGMDEPQTQQL